MVSEERHAIVTGGGSGVGAAVALRLAEAGYRVTITGRRAAPLAEVARASPRIAARVSDATNFAATRAMVDAASREFGAPFLVVANAGAAESMPFAALTADDARAAIEQNYMTVFNLWHASLPGMLPGKSGRLVTIASTAGLKGYPYVATYVAAKHAVVGLTRALGQELARTGVTVNAVCPGFTDTPMLDRSIEAIVAKTGRTAEEARAALARNNPQGRFIAPAEIAETVLWLASDAAQSVNGQAIALSGGET